MDDLIGFGVIMRPRKVCLCKSVTRADIEKAVENGVSNMPDLVKETSATTGCGTCIDEVYEILIQSLEKKRLCHIE